MANHNTSKSLLVSLGKLTLQIRDHLSKSFDQDTYVNLLEEVKQSIGDIESLTATISKEAEPVDGEVYIIVCDMPPNQREDVVAATTTSPTSREGPVGPSIQSCRSRPYGELCHPWPAG